MRFRLIVFQVLATVSLMGCPSTDEGGEDEAEGTEEGSAEEEAVDEGEQAEEASEVEPAEESAGNEGGSQAIQWREVTEDELEAEQAAALAQARTARGALAAQLMSTVMTEVQENGHAAAVTACQLQATDIAAAVAGEHDVEIGRTSHRLRNGSNQPPYWAVDYVQEVRTEPVLLLSDANEVAELTPIPLAAPCLSCHGAEDELAEGVPGRLAELYPNDEATGFAEGDIRGYFWIQAE